MTELEVASRSKTLPSSSFTCCVTLVAWVLAWGPHFSTCGAPISSERKTRACKVFSSSWRLAVSMNAESDASALPALQMAQVNLTITGDGQHGGGISARSLWSALFLAASSKPDSLVPLSCPQYDRTNLFLLQLGILVGSAVCS